MPRVTGAKLIALLFVAYAVYTASFVPALIVAPVVILLFGTLAKAILALVAAVGVWTERPWAGTLVILTGVAIAVVWLLDAFALGIVPYLYAIGAALVAVVVAIAIATYLQRGQPRRLA